MYCAFFKVYKVIEISINKVFNKYFLLQVRNFGMKKIKWIDSIFIFE